MNLADDTAVRSELAVVHVVDAGAACLVDSDTSIECECEILEELHLNIPCTIDGITLTVVHVESHGLESVGITRDWT